MLHGIDYAGNDNDFTKGIESIPDIIPVFFCAVMENPPSFPKGL